MHYQGILFDLDGTLLPMDNDRFTRGYFHLLAQAVAPLGYEEATLIPAMWKGVAAMVKNDGSRSNAQAFWEVFSRILGPQVYDHMPAFDAFYAGAFREAVRFTEPNPRAADAVALARQAAPPGGAGHQSPVPPGGCGPAPELGGPDPGGLRPGDHL